MPCNALQWLAMACGLPYPAKGFPQDFRNILKGFQGSKGTPYYYLMVP